MEEGILESWNSENVFQIYFIPISLKCFSKCLSIEYHERPSHNVEEMESTILTRTSTEVSTLKSAHCVEWMLLNKKSWVLIPTSPNTLSAWFDQCNGTRTNVIKLFCHKILKLCQPSDIWFQAMKDEFFYTNVYYMNWHYCQFIDVMKIGPSVTKRGKYE